MSRRSHALSRARGRAWRGMRGGADRRLRRAGWRLADEMRLAAVRALLQTDPQTAVTLRRLVSVAARALDAPVAQLNVITAERQVPLTQRRVVVLGQVVEDMRRMISRLLPEDIDVEVYLEAKPGLVLAGAGQLEQLLLNLVVRARDAMPGAAF